MNKVKIERCKTKKLFRTRSECPISVALDLLGDKWSLLIVRDLMLGKTTFGELLKSSEKIASNILTDRLDKLVSVGIISRKKLKSDKRKMKYNLTEQGEELLPIIVELKNWSEKVYFAKK